MISYPYIKELFTAILAQSKVIQGRFHIAPHWGTELNANNLEKVIEKALGEVPSRKYPLCIMMPPRSNGDFLSMDYGGNESYSFMLLFLTTTHYTAANQIKQPNLDTLTSTHTIVEDWHDMKRCAISFLKVLRNVLLESGNSYFRIAERSPQYIDPISTIGNDRLSGVLLQFNAMLFTGCELEDYPSDYLTQIILPNATDSHPEHLH